MNQQLFGNVRSSQAEVRRTVEYRIVGIIELMPTLSWHKCCGQQNWPNDSNDMEEAILASITSDLGWDETGNWGGRIHRHLQVPMAKGLRYSSIVCKSRVSYFSIYVRAKVESKPVGSLQPRVRSCSVILMKHQVINSVERRVVATCVTGAHEAYLSHTILSVLVNAAPEITLQTARNRHYQCSSKYKTETSMYASIHTQSERKPQT